MTFNDKFRLICKIKRKLKFAKKPKVCYNIAYRQFTFYLFPPISHIIILYNNKEEKIMASINFNNCSFHDNSTPIGHITSSSFQVSHASQKFDEKKSFRADCIDRITVDSPLANVIITASNTHTIDIHFSGEAITSQKPTFNINQNGRELIVTLTINNRLMSKELTLLVDIPLKTFEALNISSYNGKIEVHPNVSAKKMQLDTYYGTIKCQGDLSELCTSTHYGDTILHIRANHNVLIEVTSLNGDVTATLENIAISKLSTTTRKGVINNDFHGICSGYIIYGRVASHNGNITIKYNSLNKS